MAMTRSGSSPEEDRSLQEEASNTKGGMYFIEWSRIPPKLRPDWMSEELQSEKKAKEINRESQMAVELFDRFSQPTLQGFVPAPRIESLRRSPVNLVSSKPEPPAGDVCCIFPELNITLDYVKHFPGGVLEFDKVFRNLSAELKVKLKRGTEIPPSDTPGKGSWSSVESAAPYPSLGPIIVKPCILSRAKHRIGIHFPEATVALEDLCWGVRKGQAGNPNVLDDEATTEWGSRKRVSLSRNVSEPMLARASVWIDYGHPILGKFEALKALLEPGPALDADSNNDILMNHLTKRRWVWITQVNDNETVVDITRTEEFHDARLAFSKTGSTRLLEAFCDHRPCTEREMDKQPAGIRGKLKHLIMLSHMAETRMRTAPTSGRHIAAKYGAWYDFLATSTAEGDERLSTALQELEIARYFISSSRFTKNESIDDRPNELPEYHDLENNVDWPVNIIETLRDRRSPDGSFKHKSIMSKCRLFRRTKPALTSWQSTGQKLYKMQSFSPNREVECALSLIVYRQQLVAIREEIAALWEELYAVREALRRGNALTRGIWEGRCCQCGSDVCDDPESSSRGAKPFSKVDMSVEPTEAPSSEQSVPTSMSPFILPFPALSIPPFLPPFNSQFLPSVGKALSTISEESLLPTTPRLECSSEDTISDTTLFEPATLPTFTPTSTDVNGVSQHVLTGTGAPVEHMIPPNGPSASLTTRESQQSFTANTAAAGRVQDGAWLHDTDDDGQPELRPELPSIPLNAIEAVDTLQNETASLLTSDEKETEVSKQIMEPEAGAKDLNDTSSIRSLSRHGSEDSGYKSMYSSENKDGVKDDPAVDGTLNGDVCGMRQIEF